MWFMKKRLREKKTELALDKLSLLRLTKPRIIPHINSNPPPVSDYPQVKYVFLRLLCLHISSSHEQQVTDIWLERGQLAAYWIFRSKVGASLKTSWSVLRPVKIHGLITGRVDVLTDVSKGKNLPRGWRRVALRGAAGHTLLYGCRQTGLAGTAAHGQWLKKNNVFSSHLSASSSFRVRVDGGEKHAQACHILCIGKRLNINLEWSKSRFTGNIACSNFFFSTGPKYTFWFFFLLKFISIKQYYLDLCHFSQCLLSKNKAGRQTPAILHTNMKHLRLST